MSPPPAHITSSGVSTYSPPAATIGTGSPVESRRSIARASASGASGDVPSASRSSLCIASCGFDSDANRIANEAKFVKGPLVYAYAALRALAQWKPATFTLVGAPFTSSRLDPAGSPPGGTL